MHSQSFHFFFAPLLFEVSNLPNKNNRWRFSRLEYSQNVTNEVFSLHIYKVLLLTFRHSNRQVFSTTSIMYAMLSVWRAFKELYGRVKIFGLRLSFSGYEGGVIWDEHREGLWRLLNGVCWMSICRLRRTNFIVLGLCLRQWVASKDSSEVLGLEYGYRGYLKDSWVY